MKPVFNGYLKLTLKTFFNLFIICVFALNAYQWGLTGSDISAFWTGTFAVAIFINLFAKDVT